MKPIHTLIVVSFAVLLVSFWNRNELPQSIDYVPEIENEPLQTATLEEPFQVTFNDIDYLVEPEYAYDITAMVVSFRHHDEVYSSMHRLAQDHLNMLDVCVVWGDNTRAMLHEIDFWNGLFTCNVSTRDSAAWASFDMDKLSNNHLLSEDPWIRDQVRSLRVGDQIRVRGYLASYTSPGGMRGTSTTRTDSGNGACETLYIERFEILRSATNYWRWSMYGSLLLLLAGLTIHFRRPYRPYRSSDSDGGAAAPDTDSPAVADNKPA